MNIVPWFKSVFLTVFLVVDLFILFLVLEYFFVDKVAWESNYLEVCIYCSAWVITISELSSLLRSRVWIDVFSPSSWSSLPKKVVKRYSFILFSFCLLRVSWVKGPVTWVSEVQGCESYMFVVGLKVVVL
jgi:hypothetical protein